MGNIFFLQVLHKLFNIKTQVFIFKKQVFNTSKLKFIYSQVNNRKTIFLYMSKIIKLSY